MATTVQVSNELIDVLKNRKMYDNETYENVIWDLLEDSMEINIETKKEIEEARAEIKKGKYVTLEGAKKRLGINV